MFFFYNPVLMSLLLEKKIPFPKKRNKQNLKRKSNVYLIIKIPVHFCLSLCFSNLKMPTLFILGFIPWKVECQVEFSTDLFRSWSWFLPDKCFNQESGGFIMFYHNVKKRSSTLFYLCFIMQWKKKKKENFLCVGILQPNSQYVLYYLKAVLGGKPIWIHNDIL